MELAKSQRVLLAIPSRWPPIMLGITLSLFISAIFTSNFASRIMHVSVAAPGSTSSASSSLWAPSSASIPALSSQLFIILFRNSYSNAPLSSSVPSPKAPVQTLDLNATPASLLSTSELNTDHYNGTAQVSKYAESVQYNESGVPSNKPFDAGSLLGARNANMKIVHGPALTNSTSTYSGNETEPLINATASLHDVAGHSNDSKSSSEALHIGGAKESSPGSISNVSEPAYDRSSSPLSVSVTSETNTANRVTNRPLSSSQNPSNAKKCDISIGQWIEDDSYPLYHPGTCAFVDEAFSCQRNGRPDSKYNRWRWAPRDCIVPRFNGTDLLERLRGKRLVFVGDSLNRNQWESMLCMLRESLPDKRRIVQIHGGRISKLPGAYVFKFVDYECKVEFYTSQYLVDKQEGTNQTQFTIRLDRMDKSERRWRKANVLVFNTGHWWTPDKIGEGNHRFQEGSKVHSKLDVTVAFNKALSTWAKWVDTYVNLQNTSVFFRGYSPVHYIGGQWNSGGQCQDETDPIFDESFLTPYPSKMEVLEGVLHEMKLPVQLLNITRLSEFRKDAHPAKYGHAPHNVVRHQDCSHWCLPGLPDTWNELLYFALTNQSLTTP